MADKRIVGNRWQEKPALSPCFRGEYRKWNIVRGKHFQEQLYCLFWEDYINPSGFSCGYCKKKVILNWGSSKLSGALSEAIDTRGRSVVGGWIVVAVEQGQLSEKRALELVDEFDLEREDQESG